MTHAASPSQTGPANRRNASSPGPEGCFRRSKGETLLWLRERGFTVPPTRCFTVMEWRNCPHDVETAIRDFFAEFPTPTTGAAIRSSSLMEDGEETSRAGAFHSVLDIDVRDDKALADALNAVAGSLADPADQIIVQPMVAGVVMSGVVMTRHLDDGAPYYVVNYDDVSGRTDTITSGKGAHKTVYIYRGARDEYFDSSRLRAVVDLAGRLEAEYQRKPLDIEFAIDESLTVHLLQVRPIAASRHWRTGMEEEIDRRIRFIETFVRQVIAPRDGVFGTRTILGVMPDWNPAEMIGIAPRPLALSLYRHLITRRCWSLAREEMGYRKLPPAELMLSVGGRPYIDVRASFNSFLPANLESGVCERLVGAWLRRLDENPNLHDKIEFEIVHTVNDPDMGDSFADRYDGVLRKGEFDRYRQALTGLTNKALAADGTLPRALDSIAHLEALQLRERRRWSAGKNSPFDLAQHIGLLLEQCMLSGTLPFAIIARHGFIAETLMRAAVRQGALAPERAEQFKQSVETVSGKLSRDFSRVLSGTMSRDDFLLYYGHLRPGTYDILSPSYRDSDTLFTAAISPPQKQSASFEPTVAETRLLGSLFASSGLEIDAAAFFRYAHQAIAGREYGKFVFSRHVSRILDVLVEWGKHYRLTREDLSMLSIGKTSDTLFTPHRIDAEAYFRQTIRAAEEEYQLMRTFKMAYIIRSVRDIYIVPQHRSAPNFITSKRVQAPVLVLDGMPGRHTLLEGKIACIESADPGYDWVFTRNIAGLVTRYGGTNSHMAIRCAEYGLPAAIGCGDLLYDQIAASGSCLLDCAGKALLPVSETLAI